MTAAVVIIATTPLAEVEVDDDARARAREIIREHHARAVIAAANIAHDPNPVTPKTLANKGEITHPHPSEVIEVELLAPPPPLLPGAVHRLAPPPHRITRWGQANSHRRRHSAVST